MTLARQMTVDVLRALCVLALVFLVLGHKPVLAQPLAADAGYAITSLNSFCGDAPDGQAGHAPCHACRLFTGLDLPPAPACAEPAFRPAVTLAWAEAPPVVPASPALPRAHPPRAPPLA